MMTPTDWLKFYRNWTYDNLLQEIEACHKFQLDIVLRVGQKLLDGSRGYDLINQSQQRENQINEVIREKVHDGITKTDRQNES